jgi:HTH-like domain
MSERRACRLVGLDRSSYRYEPRADHNAELREELVKLARQKPRYGYRRLHVLLNKRGPPASAQRIYGLYREVRVRARQSLGLGKLRESSSPAPAIYRRLEGSGSLSFYEPHTAHSGITHARSFRPYRGSAFVGLGFGSL